MSIDINYIPKADVRQLSKRSNLWGAWLTFHVWAVIAGAMALYIFLPNPLTFIFAFFIIGSRQHGMAILMHDSAHGILFDNKSVNDFVGKYLLAAPYGGDMLTYRKYHLKHHLYAQSERDPDIALSNKFPISKASLYRKLFRDISGQTFLRLRIVSYKIRRGNAVSIEGSEAFEKSSNWPFLITNATILSVLLAIGHGWLYLTLWLLPLMTWFFVVLRLRNISEHAMTTFDDNPLTHARTTYTNILEKIFLGPYWVNYHVEHHVYMFVPCYRLKALHRAMKQAGHGPNMEIKSSYSAVLKTAITG